LAVTGRDNGEILGVRSGNVLGGVPESRGTVRKKARDGRNTEVRRGEKGSIVAPKKRTRKGRGSESDMDSLMVTTGKGVKNGGRGKGSMAHIHKNVIQTRVHRDMVTVDLMESVVRGISTCKGSIRKRSKHWKQVGPGLEKLNGGSGTAITDRVRIGIPVTDQKVIRGVKISRVR
jgi:hypothetical protein